MENRYTVLRAISIIYKIFAVLVLIGAVILGVLSVAGVAAYDSLQLGIGEGIVAFVVLLIGGAASALWLYAIGEGIQLFIDLERNGRETNMLLRALGRSLRKPPADEA